ncbi:MAG: helix-turn-helix transcriptional regulator [Anaerolineaceae bacterium]|nr:helix-turn-helix transcriptional regulator [Anaerolineaceae bacterium]
MSSNISYEKLIHLLSERNMKLYSLIRIAGVNRYTVSCIKKNKPITMPAAEKICTALSCGICDIMEFI